MAVGSGAGEAQVGVGRRNHAGSAPGLSGSLAGKAGGPTCPCTMTSMRIP